MPEEGAMQGWGKVGREWVEKTCPHLLVCRGCMAVVVLELNAVPKWILPSVNETSQPGKEYQQIRRWMTDFL